MNNPILAAIGWGAIALTAPLLSSCGQPAETPPLADATIGVPFTLTDQDGKKVSDTDFAGKYRLIYFGYTFCPDICPTDVQKLMKAFKQLETDNPALAAKIQPIFITVDPERDTPEALRNFVRAFHPRLIGLTGTDAEITAVTKGFAVFRSKVPDPSMGYKYDHSVMTLLMDPNGKPLALIPQDKSEKDILSEIERWAH